MYVSLWTKLLDKLADLFTSLFGEAYARVTHMDKEVAILHGILDKVQQCQGEAGHAKDRAKKLAATVALICCSQMNL